MVSAELAHLGVVNAALVSALKSEVDLMCSFFFTNSDIRLLLHACLKIMSCRASGTLSSVSL